VKTPTSGKEKLRRSLILIAPNEIRGRKFKNKNHETPKSLQMPLAFAKIWGFRGGGFVYIFQRVKARCYVKVF
jgi:hypothetical protein